MLIHSLVRRTLGLKDHKVGFVEDDGMGFTIGLEPKARRRLPCGRCGTRAVVRDRNPLRAWQHVPLWGIPVLIAYRPCRVRCPDCGITTEQIPWCHGKCPLTEALVIVLATWAKLLAWDVVAKVFGVRWSTVRAAVDRAVEYGLENRDTGSVVFLGIDEISRKRGHVYHTQVYDLIEKRLLWTAEGREAETLRAFFDEWGPDRTSRLLAICCDMWAPYIDVVREKAPHAILVFDKFHIVRHLLKAVNDIRIAEVAELKKSYPEILKGTRYIWLKNPWNLTDKQRGRLGFLEQINLKTNRAYLLKEAFRELWKYKTRRWARWYLKKWFWWATHSRLKPLRNFAWMLRRHEEDILNWFVVPINNGRTEALNNVAKAVSHRAHGYRTAETFRLSLLHCMGNLPMPQTVHKFS